MQPIIEQPAKGLESGVIVFTKSYILSRINEILRYFEAESESKSNFCFDIVPVRLNIAILFKLRN